jgi:hypothetical protein
VGIPTSRNPDTPEGLEQRLSVGIHRIPVELPHLSKLELRNHVRPRRILVELLCSSFVQIGASVGIMSLFPQLKHLRSASGRS